MYVARQPGILFQKKSFNGYNTKFQHLEDSYHFWSCTVMNTGFLRRGRRRRKRGHRWRVACWVGYSPWCPEKSQLQSRSTATLTNALIIEGLHLPLILLPGVHTRQIWCLFWGSHAAPGERQVSRYWARQGLLCNWVWASQRVFVVVVLMEI